MRDHNYYVYILVSGFIGTLYTGVTNDLERRVSEHRQQLSSKFTAKHHVHKLVYYEHFPDINAAILREKRIKRWHRPWKIQLIEGMNPAWRDLWLDFKFAQ